MRLWPRRRDPATPTVPEPEPDLSARELAPWVSDLADSYQRDPCVMIWRGTDEDTGLLPIITPGEELRRQGGGSW